MDLISPCPQWRPKSVDEDPRPVLYVSFHCAICPRGQSPNTHQRLLKVTQHKVDFFERGLSKMPYLQTKSCIPNQSPGFWRHMLPTHERPRYTLAFKKNEYALHAHRIFLELLETLMSRTVYALKAFRISSHTTVRRSAQTGLELTKLFICHTL